MTRHLRMVLLMGAGLALSSGAAFAQMEPPPPAPDMYGPGSLHGRLADRALRDFDLNKDGAISKAEVDKVLAQRFADAAGGAQTMNEAQFGKAHEKMLREHSTMQFHRIDWNGDGVLSLEEFRAPLRARFERMDRDGSGTISCAPHGPDRAAHRGPPASGMGHGPMHMHHMRHGHFGGRFAELCSEADLNKDGKITRAEFDKAVASKFAAAAKAGNGLSAGEFYQLELSRFGDMEARRFKRLDKNHDGKLSEIEFAAPGQRLFARLDKNHDGVVTKDELASPHHRGPHHGPRGDMGKKS